MKLTTLCARNLYILFILYRIQICMFSSTLIYIYCGHKTLTTNCIKSRNGVAKSNETRYVMVFNHMMYVPTLQHQGCGGHAYSVFVFSSPIVRKLIYYVRGAECWLAHQMNCTSKQKCCGYIQCLKSIE